MLSNSLIRNHLATNWLGRSFRFYSTIGSTNTELKSQADKTNLPNGHMLVTDYQSAGRGRLARRWEAPPQTCVMLSLFLSPSWPVEKASWLMMIAGLSACDALNEVAFDSGQARLKWPNDLVVWQKSGELQKIGGILLEMLPIEDDKLRLVVGMGINVNIPVEQLPDAHTPATSVLAQTGETVSRMDVLASLLKHFEQRYESADSGISPLSDWRKQLVNLGQPVRATLGDRVVEGVAQDVDENGRLLILDTAQTIHTIDAGDVTLRTPS